MALNRNILAQCEQLIQESETEFNSFLTQMKSNFATELSIFSYKQDVGVTAFRELAVFRMFEHAINSGEFEEEDAAEISALLKKVRADSVESLSKFHTPEAIAAASERLDEKLKQMDATNVDSSNLQ